MNRFFYEKSEAYVVRKIYDQWFLIPVKRNPNGLRIFNFPAIGIQIWEKIESFNNYLEIKQYLAAMNDNLIISENEIEMFIYTLLKNELILNKMGDSEENE